MTDKYNYDDMFSQRDERYDASTKDVLRDYSRSKADEKDNVSNRENQAERTWSDHNKNNDDPPWGQTRQRGTRNKDEHWNENRKSRRKRGAPETFGLTAILAVVWPIVQKILVKVGPYLLKILIRSALRR